MTGAASVEPSRVDVLVVGAGAAGLWAAARAAEELGPGGTVRLLEKTRRAGTKVLASGGTHCNLTTTLAADEAARLFGPKAERFLRRAFRGLPPEQVRWEFEAMGVPTVEAPMDKIFPASGRARDVRDALLQRVITAGVEVVYEAAVETVAPEADGWSVHVMGGEVHRTSRLLLCPGGASYARTGTTGDGYRWLAALDLPVVEPVPALAPLSSPAPWVHELSGIALQEATVRLRERDGAVLGERERPVLFTHRGVSGPGPMDLSVHVSRALATGTANPNLELQIDLFPDVSREALRALLLEVSGAKGAPLVARRLPRPIPRRLFRAVASAAGLRTLEPRGNELDRAERHRLVETLKGLGVPIDGTLGFDTAEVTAGGLDLARVDPGSLRVNGCEGLYVFGELLDVDGPIGGLNFQAAFATAELAALDAAR